MSKKCSKIHLRASLILKKFSRGYTPGPLLKLDGRERWVAWWLLRNGGPWITRGHDHHTDWPRPHTWGNLLVDEVRAADTWYQDDSLTWQSCTAVVYLVTREWQFRPTILYQSAGRTLIAAVKSFVTALARSVHAVSHIQPLSDRVIAVSEPSRPFLASLRFASGVGEAKCILLTAVCVSVPLRMPTLLHGPRCKLGEW